MLINRCMCIGYCACAELLSWPSSLRPHGLYPSPPHPQPQLLCPGGFSGQEYWSGLPCLLPGDLPNPGMNPRSLTLQTDSFLSEPPGKPYTFLIGDVREKISKTWKWTTDYRVSFQWGARCSVVALLKIILF